MSASTRIALAIIAVSFGILLAGCGGDAWPTPTPSTSEPGEPAAARGPSDGHATGPLASSDGTRDPDQASRLGSTAWGPLGALAETHFMDVSEAAGITARHDYVDDYFTTGQAFADYNGDGWLDLYVTDSRGLNVLYDNNRDGTFSVSEHLGQVALDTAISGGALFADYDNDGDQDLYVLNLGPNVLFRNDGDRGFTDVSEYAGVADPGKGQSAAFADYDGDGDLDLYVVNWWHVENVDATVWEQATDRLYENLGDGTFHDVTDLLSPLYTDGAGFSAIWMDYDRDGDPDLYVANDKGFDGPRDPFLPINRNVLFRNDGPGCGGWCFAEVARAAGADLRLDGMGLASADVDGDLDLDVFVTNTGQPKLLLNQGNGQFEEAAVSAGIIDDQTGWGTAFLDFDNDGDQDLYFAVGVSLGPTNPNRLFENVGGGQFVPADDRSGAEFLRYSVGVAVADFNRDGGLDLVVGGMAQGYRAFGNLRALRGEGHYTRIRLVGGGPVNRDAVGTRVYLTGSDGRIQVAEVKCGASNGAGHDLALHFGLGEAEVAEVDIRWPDGTREVIESVPLDTEWTHVHPSG